MKTDYTTLYRAWANFRSGKKPSYEIDEYAYNIEENVVKLEQELSNMSYRPNKFI